MRRSPRFPSALLALVLGFDSLPAGAQTADAEEAPRPTGVAVAGFRTLGNAAERGARTGLLATLETSKNLSLVPDEVTEKCVDGIWRREEREAAPILEKSQAAFLKGKKLYESLAIDESIVAFDEAVKGYRQAIWALRENRYLLASHLYLGMALIVRGRVREGREYIRQMVLLDSSRKTTELSVREFPPKIVSMHKALKKELQKPPLGTIVVRSQPSGARVHFDGVAQAPTPVDIPNVPRGEHFLVIERKDHRVFTQRVEVVGGENKVNAVLEAWRPLSPYPFSRRKDLEANDLLSALGKELGANVLVLGRLNAEAESSTLEGQLYDVRSREFSAIESVTVEADDTRKAGEALGKRLLSHLSEGGLVVAELASATGVPTQPQPVLAESKTPVYYKWWFWTAVGAAVVGGAVAGIILLRPEPNHNVLSISNPGAP